MHRGKKRVPSHRFPVDSIPGTFGTGYSNDDVVVGDVDERRMRGYPRELRLERPKADPSILRRIMRAARAVVTRRRRAQAEREARLLRLRAAR